MPTLERLLDLLWQDYASLCPSSHRIHALLRERGETIVNDHIALRTFDDPRVALDVLAAPFTRLGYAARDRYTFPEKKLAARHFEHPDDTMPKVFISELRLADFSPSLRGTVGAMLDALPAGFTLREDLPVAGRPWRVSFAQYEALRAESEYAAWVAAFGFRANHFTILVNALQKLATLQELNAFLKRHGFELNASGGEIKGSPAELLEQSSTLADRVSVSFADGPQVIPACYYEFARRYPKPDGRLFSGFVAQSADKIFESTNKR